MFGYRPTWGEHRLHGVMEASGSLDTLGILARSVEDVALYRDVLLGITPEPIADARPRRRTSRSARATSGTSSSPITRTLVEDAALRLARAGAHVSEFELPADFERLNEAHRWISSFEFARTFTWEIENHWDEISDTLARRPPARTASAATSTATSPPSASPRNAAMRLDDLWGDIDVLLTPAAFGEAPVGFQAFEGVPMFQLWTILHVPAITLPVFSGPAGMPIGAQLLARRHDDRNLFACAQWAYRKLM